MLINYLELIRVSQILSYKLLNSTSSIDAAYLARAGNVVLDFNLSIVVGLFNCIFRECLWQKHISQNFYSPEFKTYKLISHRMWSIVLF